MASAGMEQRVSQLKVVLVLACLAVAIRLAQLQLVQGQRYRDLAEQNRLRLVPELAPRGLIVDRRGRILASNQTLFRVSVVPQEVEDLDVLLARVASIVHLPSDQLLQTFRRERSLAFLPATIVSRVSKETAIQLEENGWRLPGVLVRPETVRHYPLGATAAQLLGYLSQPTADEVPLLKEYGVRAKQLIGRSGIEQLLDHALQGESGGLMVEVNHRGRQMRIIGRRAPHAGATVVLTLDTQLQSLIEQSFGTRPGACVVLDPSTGEVLAIASLPTFTPESFVVSDADAVEAVLNSSLSPLMNRAAVGRYQPGSIMKLVTAGAGLEHQIITPATSIVCPGAMKIGDRVIHCWNRDGHGPMVLAEALMQSCNVYFMHVARRLGADRLRAAQAEMGFSRRTGWVMDEQSGSIPQRRLTEGELAMLGIGQGELLVTPLEAAVMAGAFASGGWLVEPWIVQTVGGRPVNLKPSRRHLSWSAQTLTAIREGMKAVVIDPSGTGHRAWSPSVSIAGKTGTAQTHIPGQTHGWFVGFCPVDKPRVAMAILAEHGGSGGELPAEVAKTICEYVSAPGTL